jgi:hypothetical protein
MIAPGRGALRDREMGHEVAVCRSVPVLHGVRGPMDVTGMQLDDVLTP